MSVKIKTRFAPSPTGQMHFGNIRTALFSALLAQKTQGTFLLRIENTDEERSQEALEIQISEDLQWLGIDWQEGFQKGGAAGPYRQSDRKAIYDQYFERLKQNGIAYPCFCTEQELAVERHVQLSQGKPPRYSGKCRKLSAEAIQEKIQLGLKPTLRFRVQPDAVVSFSDLIKGPQKMVAHDIGDFIIRRQTGTAAFFFCNAIDDALMGVTHVLRGEDHLTNTPRQLLILDALGLKVPEYGHLPMILGTDGAKLSKRNGSLSVQDAKSKGLMPQAIVNYLARLGHHYPPAQMNQQMSFEELASYFEWGSIGHAAAHYDEHQLQFWQKQAVMTSLTAEIEAWVGDFSTPEATVPPEQLSDFIARLKTNWLVPQDARDWVRICYGHLPFRSVLEQDSEKRAILQQAGIDFFHDARKLYEARIDFSEWVVRIKAAQPAKKGAALFKPLRLALTGCLDGPEMHQVVALIPSSEIAARLACAAELAVV